LTKFDVNDIIPLDCQVRVTKKWRCHYILRNGDCIFAKPLHIKFDAISYRTKKDGAYET